MEGGGGISASDWAMGILLSVLASLVGGASKLAIRKSWLLQARRNVFPSSHDDDAEDNDDATSPDTDLLHAEHTVTVTSSSTPRLATGTEVPVGLGGLYGEEDQSRLLLASSCSGGRAWIPYAIRYSGMFGMSVLNPICCVLAMNYASPSILAPFSGLTLVWVILGSPIVNSEQPSYRQIMACCWIILGEVIVAIFGDHTNDEGVTVEDVRKSYSNPAFVLYFVGLALYVAVLAYLIRFSKSSALRRFAWGSCGGSITGAQNFLKDSLTILKAAGVTSTPLPWFFYLFLLLAGGTALVGLLILTACMKRYDATYSAASFVGSFVVSASIMASVHYNTFASLIGFVNYMLYPLGLAVLMFGVYQLVQESREAEEDGDGVMVNAANEGIDDRDNVDDENERMFGYSEVDEETEPPTEPVF